MIRIEGTPTPQAKAPDSLTSFMTAVKAGKYDKAAILFVPLFISERAKAVEKADKYSPSSESEKLSKSPLIKTMSEMSVESMVEFFRIVSKLKGSVDATTGALNALDKIDHKKADAVRDLYIATSSR